MNTRVSRIARRQARLGNFVASPSPSPEASEDEDEVASFSSDDETTSQ